MIKYSRTINKVNIILTAGMYLFFSMAVLNNASASIEIVYEYSLSDFGGAVTCNWASLFVDTGRNEIYVVDPDERDVRIFNEKGMEIFRFGDDGSLGSINDVAVKENGDIIVLSNFKSTPTLLQCNFRGEVTGELSIERILSGFQEFIPSRMVYKNRQFYLIDIYSMKIVVTDSEGYFQNWIDLALILNLRPEKQAGIEIGGINVDYEGNILFTVPVFFTAYILDPEGNIKGFGSPGSSPGRFGVIGGITTDDYGNIYVADRLRSVVLIFDRYLKFMKEFGYRGGRQENLISPMNIAFDDMARLYVSQLRSRGVSVFKIMNIKANGP